MKKLISYFIQPTIIGLAPVIVGLFIFGATAQTTNDTLKKTQHINDVIVTGQYGEGSLTKSVYKVRIIDQKRIQLQGANNLKDVLTNELNVRIANDPALGGSVSIQGISGQNVKIMVDGIPVVGREGGMIDLNQINLNNIERIELVEGPMSVSFGTDALGGVINLISKKTTTGYRLGASSYYETVGKYNAGINGGITIGKWNTAVNVARNFFDGYSPNESSRVQLWKPNTQYFGDIAVNRALKKATLQYKLSAFDEKVIFRDSANITPYYAYGNDQYFYTRRLTNALFYDRKINHHFQLNIVGSYNYYRRIRNTVRKDLVSLEEQPIASPDVHDTTYFHNTMSRGTLSRANEKSQLNYQVGYEYNRDETQGNRIINAKQSMTDISAFGSVEIKTINRILIRPGIRVIHNTKFQAPFIPSLNVKWDITDNIVLRASYGKGFRAPSLKELYLNFVDPNHNVQGNTNLKAETQDNMQIGLCFEWKKLDRVFRVEPSLFYNRIHNKIDLVMNPLTQQTQYNNISEFKSTGANVSTEYRAPNYAFVLGYAVTGINNTLQQSSVTNTYFFTQEVRSNIVYTFPKKAITASVFYKFNAKQRNYQYDVKSGSIINGYIDGFHLLDASLAKSFFNKKLSITAGFKNILNVININANIPSGIHTTGSNNASIAMGRTCFISCAYNLSWN